MGRVKLTSRQDGLLAVPGLRASATVAGIKETRRPDLALVVAEAPRPMAGVFTKNQAAAPPVLLCRRILDATDRVRAVVVNSGNANALTGATGLADAKAMVEATEQAVGGPALVLSTGIIGVPLPIESVLRGIGACAAELEASAAADLAFAEAMRTTDTFSKTACAEVHLRTLGRRVVVGGTAKGSGMIHPDMATMLAVLATDAPVTPRALRPLLREVVDRSFHQISVDGDTSTNDAVLLWGGEGESLLPGHPDWRDLVEAMTAVAQALARQIVEDGEGRSRILRIDVHGAANDEEARRVARSVATSFLVKTALAGGDPNWGRLVSAAANAGVPLDLARLQLRIGGQVVYAGGERVEADPTRLRRDFSAREVHVAFALGGGPGRARVLTTDLTKRYVEINSEYTT